MTGRVFPGSINADHMNRIDVRNCKIFVSRGQPKQTLLLIFSLKYDHGQGQTSWVGWTLEDMCKCYCDGVTQLHRHPHKCVKSVWGTYMLRMDRSQLRVACGALEAK